MESHLPKAVQDGLDAARKAAPGRARRLRVETGGAQFQVTRAWENGFALDVGAAPVLRGRVTLYEGSRLLSYCLIVASEEQSGEMQFEYKRITEASATQPLDYYRRPHAPVALLDGPEAGTETLL